MHLLKRLFYFLGSLRFALSLITVTAFLIFIGTLIEANTHSHLLAARYTYAHPFFIFLLGGFFINILFSAILRWPFQKKHIPFLMTHLGLLMVLAGTMIKNRYGLQGQLVLWEGREQQDVLVPQTHALYLEKKTTDSPSSLSTLFPLTQFQEQTTFTPFPTLKCTIKGYAPHVKEELEMWIKGSHAYLFGHLPFPVHRWHRSTPFPKGQLTHFPSSSFLWNVSALQTSDRSAAIEKGYLQGLNLCLTSKTTPFDRLIIPLENALKHPFSFAGGTIHTFFSFPEKFLEKKQVPFIQLSWHVKEKIPQDLLLIHLTGEDALYNHPLSAFKSPFTVDLERSHPSLCFIAEEGSKKNFLFAFDSYGRIQGEDFDPSDLESLVAYHQGFGGYTLQTLLSHSKNRKEKEKSDKKELQKELEKAFANHPPLAPPLFLFKHACEEIKTDFCSELIEFLIQWEGSSRLLFHPHSPLSSSLEQVLDALQWETLSLQEKKALPWIQRLFNQLEQESDEKKDFFTLLEMHHWPFLKDVKKLAEEKDLSSLPSIVAQQLLSIASFLPPLPFPTPCSPEEHASLLSTYFKTYDIDYSSLRLCLPPNRQEQEKDLLFETFVLETPLTTHIFPEDPPLKLEEHRPGLVLELEEGEKKQMIALAYDPLANELKWPILQGRYLIRFQSDLKSLPYKMQLKEARRLHYPDSRQVYSYESDLWFSKEGHPPILKTLSMNEVHETSDGYRFYLAGVGESRDRTSKNIQLTVNYDPVKYSLTYPGTGLIFLGTFFLFWKPSRRFR